MLKNLITRRTVQTVQRQLSSGVPVSARSKYSIRNTVPDVFPPSSQGRGVPSTNLSVLLTNISGSTTESSLKEALSKDATIRKIELEPGCTLHFLDESQAEFSGKLIKDQLNLKTQVIGATIPSLLIRNLSENISVESLKKSFEAFNPQTIKIAGGLTVDVVVFDAENAVKTSKEIEAIKFDGHRIKTTTVKLGNKYTVHAYNFPASVSQEDAEKNIMKAVSDSTKIHSVVTTTAAPKTVVVRLSSENSQNLTAIKEALSKINVNGATITVSDANLSLRKPAIVIRNLKGFTDEQSLVNLFSGRNAERVQVIWETKDRIESVIAYFGDERDALNTLQSLKDANLNGKQLKVIYRDLVEPAVTVTNLPANVTEQEISALFGAFNVGKISIQSGDDVSSAVVYLSSSKEASLAFDALNRKRVQDRPVVLSVTGVSDIGLSLSAPIGSQLDEQSIVDALQSVGVTAKSLTHDSNKSAFIGFLNASQATGAQNGLLKGSTQVESTAASSSGRGVVLSSSLTVAPSFVLQVMGLSPESPASDVSAAIIPADVHCVKMDRTALVKFKIAKNVSDGVKTLKTIKLDDKPVKVRKYQPLSASGTSEYDLEDDHAMNKMDQYSLKSLLKDYLYTDPATRYQVAKNFFERTLHDAKTSPDLQRILDESATSSMKTEVAQLLKTVSTTSTAPEEVAAASQRLFELFLQREDMRRFSGDFKEIEAFLGPMNEADPFDWTQFQLDNEQDSEKLQKEIKRVEKIRAQKLLDSLDGLGEGGGNTDKELLIKGENGKPDVRVSLEDPNLLRDRDGNIWSGVILDEDTVQKVTPGQRLVTFRVLVVVGNMRGACGFGMGKGQTGGEALNAAFRAALRDLKHIDLFENFGLAHDVFGQHNSCRAYIGATPRSREFVGSKFAYEILTRFGIGACSIKLNGRRDPYAMTNAIFNAVTKHENIDEFAKDRGKRYLSLKWAYDNSV